jgi:hypothetical protein
MGAPPWLSRNRWFLTPLYYGVQVKDRPLRDAILAHVAAQPASSLLR